MLETVPHKGKKYRQADNTYFVKKNIKCALHITHTTPTQFQLKSHCGIEI